MAGRRLSSKVDLMDALAHRLKAEYCDKGAARLPSVRQLAQSLDASPGSISRALKHLETLGLVRIIPRCRAVVLAPGTAAGEAPTRLDAADRLKSKIREDIASGAYRNGQPLPKATVLSRHYRMGTATVCRALARLGAEGLTWKDGKIWKTGPPPTSMKSNDFPSAENPSEGMPSVQSFSAEAATLLVLVPSYDVWSSLCQESRLRQFTEAFLREMDAAHIRLRVVTETPLPPHGLFTAGREGIRALIRNLGPLYAGALIPRLEYTPDVLEWAEWLCGFGRPVLWFDGDPWDGRRWEAPLGIRGLYHCHASFRAAVKTAWSSLTAKGHRRIGLVNYQEEYSSACRKMAQWLQESAAATASTPRSTPNSATEFDFEDQPTETSEAWQAGGLPHALATIRRLASRADWSGAGPRHRNLLHRIQCTPALIALLRRFKATALLTPDPHSGLTVFYWLEAVGLPPPRSMSLVAVGAIPEYLPFPVAAIDLGLERLGYLAARALAGGSPVRAARNGLISSPQVLAERGSLHAPADSETMARALSRLFGK